MNTPEKEGNIEYNYEEGLEEALNKITDLLSFKDIVVVAVIGSDVNVGKTHLSIELSKKLMEKGARVQMISEIASLNSNSTMRLEGKGVLILHSEYLPYIYEFERGLSVQEYIAAQNQKLHEKAQDCGLEIEQIDLRILIHRDGSEFQNFEPDFADILIKNEKATDKP